MNQRKLCLYNKCNLPKNNKRFLWQILYLIISVFTILKPGQFSALTIFLFVFPILLDIYNFDIATNNKDQLDFFIIKIVILIYKFFNISLLIISFLGLSNIFIFNNNGDISFSKNMLIDFELVIPLNYTLFLLVADILFSLIMYFGAPCQAKAKLYSMTTQITNKIMKG